MKLSSLWRWDGQMARGEYTLWGLILFGIKYNLDRLVAGAGYQHDWSLWYYLFPARLLDGWFINNLPFCLMMVAIALPFIWVGVAMTLRRLRSLGWPLALVLLFFVPLVSLAFFTLLCLLPGRPVVPPRWEVQGWMAWMPASRIGSAFLGMAVTVAVGVGAAFLSVNLFAEYGLGLFVLVPFCCGLLSVLIYGAREPRRKSECLWVSVFSVLLLGAGFLIFAMEGAICLLMAAPLAVPLALVGGMVGYTIQNCGRRYVASTIPTMSLLLPLLLTAEHASHPLAPLLEVRSSVEITGTPSQVWPQVVAFTELPPPTEWLFRAGIAFPKRAEISGCGVGAVRHCVFSTGPFVEPIEVWDEPHLLRFGVTSNPPPMEEWTPYEAIHPPHLKGFLASERGQFRLIDLGNGRTRLEGTTWYRHNLWPVNYWQAWSDYIIHRIHLRVLQHIKQQVEQHA